MAPEQRHIIASTATGGPVAFSREERERHLYIVGKSGSGKSTVLFNLAMADIAAGEGVAVIDPHGDLAEAIIDAIPPERTHQVCYLNVADTEYPVGFNPLARVPVDRRALAASGIVSAFKHLWRESWGPRLEHFLFQGVAALLESPRPTLLDLSRIYTDRSFRDRLVSCCGCTATTLAATSAAVITILTAIP
jgi:type IV secretory pathway VirB4 component